jgi:hypothetical protein
VQVALKAARLACEARPQSAAAWQLRLQQEAAAKASKAGSSSSAAAAAGGVQLLDVIKLGLEQVPAAEAQELWQQVGHVVLVLISLMVCFACWALGSLCCILCKCTGAGAVAAGGQAVEHVCFGCLGTFRVPICITLREQGLEQVPAAEAQELWQQVGQMARVR